MSYGELRASRCGTRFLDRAFECWIHAGDIAEAVDYPYDPPAPRNLHRMIDLAARLLPSALADRRRAGLAALAPPAGARRVRPGRSLHLEIEGDGRRRLVHAAGLARRARARRGRRWSPMWPWTASSSASWPRATSSRRRPRPGQDGDRDAIRDVLFAAASLSRL